MEKEYHNKIINLCHLLGCYDLFNSSIFQENIDENRKEYSEDSRLH